MIFLPFNPNSPDRVEFLRRDHDDDTDDDDNEDDDDDDDDINDDDDDDDHQRPSLIAQGQKDLSSPLEEMRKTQEVEIEERQEDS